MTTRKMSEEEKHFWEADFEPEGNEPLPTREEWIGIVDEMMRTYFIGRHYIKIRYWDVEDELSDSRVLKLISEHPKRWMHLHRMVTRMEPGSRFDFWKLVFKNRQYVEQNELLNVWFDCLNDRGSHSYQKVTPPCTAAVTFEEYVANVSDSKMLKASIITEPLLIDDPIVSFRYCQVQKPGWEMLQYINGRRHQTLNIPEKLRQAISEDFLPLFAINQNMTQQKISFSLLTEILEAGSANIFRYLLENDMIPDEVISLPELCCYLTARFPDDLSVPLLTALEEVHPGLLKGVTDYFGRNLLWYAVQNMRTGWFHPDCKLTPFLLEHGCNPKNTNQIDLPWQFVTKGLSCRQKTLLMRRRHNNDRNSLWTANLRKNQPLERI